MPRTLEGQRMWDLVRQQRMELLQADLITQDEYAALAVDHPAVARLESYDELRSAHALTIAAADKLAGALKSAMSTLDFAISKGVLECHGVREAAKTALAEYAAIRPAAADQSA